MSDYKCDICEKKATVHITKFIDGQKFKFHLCEACAKNNQDKLKALIDTQIELKGKKNIKAEDILGEMIADKKDSHSGLTCPHCKSTFEEFEKATRISCEHCYDAFADRLEDIIGQMHLSKVHKGKTFSGKAKAAKLDDSTASSENVSFEDLMDLVPDEPIDKDELIKQFQKELDKAIAEERYEDAAELRDQIKSLEEVS